jgi:uncharacterized SAM-binding protein YcdF (DUF218 family)
MISPSDLHCSDRHDDVKRFLEEMMSETRTTASYRPSVTGFAMGLLLGLLVRDLDLATLVSFWRDVNWLILPCALAVALLWRTRLRVPIGLTVGALAVTWLLVALTPISARLADGLVRREPPRPADAVFVLASRLQADGDLTGTAMARLLHGLELVGEGHAPRLILSELYPPSARYAVPARALIADLRLTGELFTVGPVYNTRDEARAVARLCRDQGWHRILLVTSPVHSRRACATFEREGLEIVSSPSVETRYDLERLDQPGDRLMAFSSVMHERVGLWVYARRGWI